LGQTVVTNVDSEIAKYYLERGGSPGTEVRFEEKIRSIHSKYDSAPLDWITIKNVSAETSADFGAIYFARRLQMDSESSRFQNEFQRQYECIKSSCPDTRILRPLYSKYKMLVIGGLHYKSNKTTGADLAGPRKYLAQNGFEVELLDVDEDGIVEENAATIAQRIRSETGEKKILLVSASKGGLDVAYALGKLLTPDESIKVKGWVSIGGILQGTFLADDAVKIPKWWAARLVLWWEGVDAKCVRGMTTDESRRRFRSLVFPKHILMVSYIGAPLSGQLAKDVVGRYTELRNYGPSDGLTLLPDALIPDGKAVLEWGLDHYFRDPDIHLKALALANVIVEELD
jgi:hypothetical protein